MAVTVTVGEARPGETAPRRAAKVAEKALDRPPNMKCSTVYEFILECCEKHGGKNAIGWRDIIDVHEETKTIEKFNKKSGQMEKVDKNWLYYELSGYHYNTFTEVIEVMHSVGRGLVKLGMEPKSEDKLHIFAATSHKWMKMFLGAQSQGIPIVTAYDTLGEKGLIHSLKQTSSAAIYTDNQLLGKLINPLKVAEKIRYVIYYDNISAEDKRQGGKLYREAQEAVDKIKEVRPDIKLVSFDELLELGQKAKGEIEPHPPTRDDISCIMYTSGSTGDPKGVVLKHSNVVAGVGGATINVCDYVGDTDKLICFLPLAHIFEMAFELLSFHWGSCIGYANVKTLTSASVRNCKSDLEEFQPTIMVGVAAVWETVKKGILNQINELPRVTKGIFWAAYHSKLKMQKMGIPGGDTIGNIIFKKVRKATGGHLRYLLNGGSPISVNAQEFISNLICPMLIGYGLTETCASLCILNPGHFEYGVVGDLTGCVTVKLVDVEELGYFAKDNKGEIWVKGENVLPEYYKNEEETKESLTEDGWFKTGDIGMWTDTGSLKIIDRKKNLVKTMNGEYIALEKLESVYRSNSYVQNICVYADQNKVKPVGIIVPNHTPLVKLAKELGIMKKQETDIEPYLHNKKLQNAVFEDMIKTAKKQGLVGIELLQGAVFFDDEWTPQNGFVTSAQKLQRKKILKAVEKDVESVYAD